MTDPQKLFPLISPLLASMREQAETLIQQLALAEAALDAKYSADHGASYYDHPWGDAPALDHDCPEGDALSRIECIEIHLKEVVDNLMHAEELC